MGDLPGALENYEKWSEVIEQLSAESPDNMNYRADVVRIYGELAFNHAARGQYAVALDWLQKGLPVAQEVLLRQPRNVRAQEALAVNYIRIATVRAASGDLTGALGDYQKCLEIRQPMVAADPLDGGMFSKFADTLDIASTVAAEAGRASDAERYMTQLIAAQKKWTERPNATAHDWDDYARRLLNCSPTQLRQPTLALSAARKAVAMSDRHDGNLLDTLSRAFAATGDAAQAATVENEAIAALAVTASKVAASAEDVNDYAYILVTCQLSDLRKPSVALTYAKRAAEMSSHRDPAILDTLAQALFATGDRAQAIQLERDAIAKSWDAPPEKKQYTDNLRRYETAK
jgi:tetratricopeptide (TPR) repeat protein